jgi:hypothetical protein
VLWALCLLLALQRPLVHLLGLDELALGCIEVRQVVDRVERRRVLWPLCLLLALQRPLVHLLGLDELALVGIEET